MKNKLLTTLIILFITACKGSDLIATSTLENTTEFIDASGQSVRLSKFPERIVIEGRLTQMIVDFYYLFPDQGYKLAGIQKRLQTVKDFLEIIDPELIDKLTIEQDATAEQVIPLNPDLVIMKSALKNKIGSTFSAIKVPVVYMDFEDPSQIKREITNLGLILNQPMRAEELNSLFFEWEKKVTDVTEKIPMDQKPSVLLLQYTEQGGEIALDVPPANWLQTSMVEMAGGMPKWKESVSSGGWMTVGFEQIAAWNPDIIFIINYYEDSKESVEKLKINPAWMELKAVKNNQIYGFASDFLSWDQPDPRWILGLNWLGNKIHPDLILFDMNEDPPRFFNEFYGISREVYLEKIMPVLKGSF